MDYTSSVIKESANEFTKPSAVILKGRGLRKDVWMRLLIFKAKVKEFSEL